MTLVGTASKGLYSPAGTCLRAAAWMTMSTPSKASLRPVAVAHVADEVAQAVVIVAADAHHVLLQLVSAEDQLGAWDGTRPA